MTPAVSEIALQPKFGPPTVRSLAHLDERRAHAAPLAQGSTKTKIDVRIFGGGSRVGVNDRLRDFLADQAASFPDLCVAMTPCFERPPLAR